MATTNISSSDFLAFNDNNEAIQLTSGTTAERPSSASNGEMRYNTTDNKVEYYDGANWIRLSDGSAAFYSIDFMVLAGGGSGGSGNNGYRSAGGGAGGYRTSYGTTSGGGATAEAALEISAGTIYTIGVGGGASFGNGTDSFLSGSDITTITSVGGGRGGENSNGSAGGSGGGGSYSSRSGGAGTANQGFAGGNASGATFGAGGGGAGSVGVDANSTRAGGAGLSSSITGSLVGRAGGGGGANGGSASDGGAAGAPSNNTRGSNAAANTAGGGGGSANYPNPTGAGFGGSGLVVLRMPTSKYSGTTTGSPTVSTDGSDTILIYTGSGTYTA